MTSKYFSSTITECLFVLTVTFAFAQSTIFSGMATVMTDSIGRDLEMGDQVTWITSACLLTSGAFVLPFGNLSDMIGRKKMALTAMICSSVGVFAAGWAPDGTSLIIFTSLIGLFSAAAVTPAVGQLGAVYSEPSKRRNRAFACFSAGNPLGFVCGSFIAGIVLKLASWRPCFWVFAVLCLLFALLVQITVPADVGTDHTSFREAFLKFDLLGALLVTTGVSLLSAGLTLAGVAPHGWGTHYVIVLVVLSIFFLGIFIYWQSIYKFPLMPLYIWRDRNFSLLITLLSIGNAAFTCSSFWLCLYLQRVKHMEALWIAIYLLPQNINGFIINFVCSLILHRVNHRTLMGVGAAAYLISFLLLALLQPIRYFYWAFVFPYLMLAVVGADIQFNVANSYVMSALPKAQQSLAGGILSAVNKLTSNIALSVSTAVYLAGKDAARENDDLAGYTAAFWMIVAVGGVNLLLVPFLRLEGKKIEGAAPSTESTEECVIEDEAPEGASEEKKAKVDV